jgi:hypothetical protein
VQAVAPALPLHQLLRDGKDIGPQLRERPRRNRPSQMVQLVKIMHTLRN